MGPDIFVAKLDAESKPLWTRQLHARNGDGNGVAFDREGNVIVTGYVFGGMICDDMPSGLPVNQDILVSKLDPDGNLLWTRVFPAPGDQAGVDVLTNSDGDIVVAGYMTAGDLTFDEIGTTLHTNGLISAVLMKLSPNGSVVWAKSFGGSQSAALAVDSGDNIVLTGDILGTTDFGGAPLTAGYDRDTFLAKFDDAGNHLWSQSFEGTASGTMHDVAVDSADNILLLAPFNWSVDMGGGPIVNPGSPDTALAKYDPSGHHLWSRGLVSVVQAASTQGMSIDVDGADNVIVGGSYVGTADLGGGPLVNTSALDIFLAKFDPSGGWLANQRFSTQAEDETAAIRMDHTGRVILTGRNASIDFGGAPKVHNTVPGQSDFFVAWLAP
ncbi:hypothetical protein E8A74_44050 [Polyangium fumosum]|uniref:Beta-propeller repeat protein n=1 Tax=Polyangium fumosum TaxID=889272 RepID=A0A4U1IS87_9BACT|nr:hypothetical protein E8A74_44050 [Polyangium fumosum]